MSCEKYFDYDKDRFVDIRFDGCALSDWHEKHQDVPFAAHPKGFPVFLSPSQIADCDEYSQSDPYSVEANIHDAFHKRRIACTLTLLGLAADESSHPPAILDLGCGQGHITERIRDAYPNADISGMDYSITAIEYAVDHFSDIDFCVADAYHCPYAEGFFDIVVCNNLWEHVPDPILLLLQMSRVLKPRGFIILSTPSRYRLRNLVRIIMGKPVVFMSRHHVTEYSIGQVIEQLRYGGFELVACVSTFIRPATLKENVAQMFFSPLLALTGSHHRLESTPFFLARRNAD